MYRLGLVLLPKLQNFDVALELSRQFGGECNLKVGAVIRNADIQKLFGSTFYISVGRVAYL